jgi:hypothetical protein
MRVNVQAALLPLGVPHTTELRLTFRDLVRARPRVPAETHTTRQQKAVSVIVLR